MDEHRQRQSSMKICGACQNKRLQGVCGRKAGRGDREWRGEVAEEFG